MKPNKRRIQKTGSGKHTAKTPSERDAYNEKVKLAAAEGETAPSLTSRTSTLSARSVYGSESGAGIPDRDPIKPPGTKEVRWPAKLGLFATVVSVLVVFAGIIVWGTTLKNRVDFNEKGIDHLSASLKETDGKRQELATRIAKLEQWRDIFSRDLDGLQRDMRRGGSEEQLESRLRHLENRMYERMGQK